jgi:putative serine protease PepD
VIGTLRSGLLGGVIGGVVVAGVFAVIDSGSQTTRTVVQQPPLSATSSASQASAAGLTARQIYQRDAPGVVRIKAQIVQQVQSPFGFGLPQQQAEATGSGFVVDSKGDILTNAHVIDGAGQITVQFEHNVSKIAKVIGKDVSDDLALLKVDPTGIVLDPLTLGNSSSVQVGDPVVAIGNPFGLDRTLTTGVVSALQRQIQAPNNFSISNVIQTDAAINPGNSGGPLIDAFGRVIGVTSQIQTSDTSGNGNIGIGFAEPSNTARQVIADLEKTGQVQHAYLGIEGTALDPTFSRLNLPGSGVLVESVVPDGPAARAGIRGGDTNSAVDMAGNRILLGGDVITSLDGKPVGSMEDLISIIANHKPGDTVQIGLLRGGQRRTVSATLVNRPSAIAQ